MSNFELLEKYMRLKQPVDIVQLNYLWIHSEGCPPCIRGKTKTVSFVPTHPDQVPLWRCCGNASVGYNAEFDLMPVALYDDPLREGKNKIVLCELGDIYRKPPVYNKRHNLLRAVNDCRDLCDPWLQVTQSYTLMDKIDDHPLGWPKYGYPAPQSHYYCGVGAGKVFGRDLVEAHYRACLYSGVSISAESAHFLPSKWQFQLGYAACVAVIDDLWMSRFLLSRIAEHFNLKVSFDDTAIPEFTNLRSLSLNLSTKQMREKNGFRFNDITLEKNCDQHKCTLSFDESLALKAPDDEKDAKSNDSITDAILIKHNGNIFEQLSEECGFIRFCGTDSIFDPYEVTNSIVNKVCFSQ